MRTPAAGYVHELSLSLPYVTIDAGLRLADPSAVSQTSADSTVQRHASPQRHGAPAEHRAATVIQTSWRGYRTRNLNSAVSRVKQEIRCRRLEETVAFLLSEMNR